MGVYLSGLAILRRMSINQVMREACLPVEYVGSSSNPAPSIQPFGNLTHLSQNRTNQKSKASA